MSNTIKIQKATFSCIIVFEIIILVLYALFMSYGRNADPKVIMLTPANNSYGMFQNIQIMVFIGFGLLMTFLRKYGYSALGFTFLMSCVVIQEAILLDSDESFQSLSLKNLVNADIAAATFLISFGAVLGKVNSLQLFFMAVIETACFMANKFFIEHQIMAQDVGGSMVVHQFGAYYGLAVSLVLGLRKGIEKEGNSEEKTTYINNIFAMIGTLFLWAFWPSFNGVFSPSDQKNRIIINTYLSLTASCLTASAFSIGLSKGWKLNMVHVQNATLAGGVAVGAVSNMFIQPRLALFIGATAGIISVLGFRYFQGGIHRKLRIHDTCGVHNLHGLPGVFGGFISCPVALLVNLDLYGDRLYEVYSESEEGRSNSMQAVYQLSALGATFVSSICGGLITGLIVVFIVPNLDFEERFKDEIWWNMEEGEEQG